MKTRDIGAIFLILGTTVGVAMLALPVVTASESFSTTLWVVVFAWALMTTGAWALMRVNFLLPPGSNLLSMARATLGKSGYVVTGLAYLMLLYSLLSAYLAGSSDVLQALLSRGGIHLPLVATTMITALIFGSIVFKGVGSVDWVNRFLMLFKLLALFVLMYFVFPTSHWTVLTAPLQKWPDFNASLLALCAFGFAIILPTLRVYLNNDAKRLKKVLLIGSVIPLFLYLLWIGIIQGSITRYGADGLLAMNGSAHTNSLLMQKLVELTQSSWLHVLSRVFISICAMTAFLGVSLCLFDFLKDGLKRRALGRSRVAIAALTYLPPLVVVLVDPSLFIQALAYAGLLCIILLVVLPILMYVVARRRGMTALNANQ